jgi:AcrR family transcriptional regulator
MQAHPASRADDSRSLATRAALVECAEALFARHGIDGVSLRQIGQASGSANSSVVAYHFGSKEALLRAVIGHRLPAIEARRGELLAAARAGGEEPGIAALVDLLFRPFFEQTDADGRHSYARFLAELHRADLIGVRDALSGEFPITRGLVRAIEQAVPPGAASRFRHRMLLASTLVFAAIRNLDQAQPDPAEAASLFGDALLAACAVFVAAPPS